MALLLTLMVNQASISAILLEKLRALQAAYCQPPSYADWKIAFTEHRHYSLAVVSVVVSARIRPFSSQPMPCCRRKRSQRNTGPLWNWMQTDLNLSNEAKVEGRSRLLKIEFRSKSVSGKLLRKKNLSRTSTKFWTYLFVLLCQRPKEMSEISYNPNTMQKPNICR